MRRERMEQKYPGLFARLGVECDTDLADEYGISAMRIGQFRREYGIPTAASYVVLTREQVEQEHPGLVERLGVEFDSVLAEEYGISAERLGRFRRSLGIPPAKPRGLPTADEWARLLAVKGDVTIGADRCSVVIGGTTIRGKTLRQAIDAALRGVAR